MTKSTEEKREEPPVRATYEAPSVVTDVPLEVHALACLNGQSKSTAVCRRLRS